MSTVRDLVTEAFNRTNLVPRKRDLPPDLLQSGINLLKGVLQDFSNKKYIQAYKSEVEFYPHKEKIVVGPYKLTKEHTLDTTIYEFLSDRPVATQSLDYKYCYVKENKTAYQCQAVSGGGFEWISLPDAAFLFDVLPDVELKDLMTPTQAYFKDSISSYDWIGMPFISYDQLYSISYGDFVVSWKPSNEGTYDVFFKPRFITQNRLVKLIYNIVMDYNDNDVISLPAPYLELLTRALAYKIAVEYPRVDATKMGLLKAEYEELSNNLEASNASQRIITREVGNGGRTLMGSFLDGSFISSRW